MITRTRNGITMNLHARCYWAEWCDVGIIQTFKGTQNGDIFNSIEMTADEAERLIAELQAAIAEARRIDAEYLADMERERVEHIDERRNDDDTGV